MESLDKFGGFDRIPLKKEEIAPGVGRVDVWHDLAASETSGLGVKYIYPPAYRGKDGHDYLTYESLQAANRFWMAINFPELPYSKFLKH